MKHVCGPGTRLSDRCVDPEKIIGGCAARYLSGDMPSGAVLRVEAEVQHNATRSQAQWLEITPTLQL